MGRPRGAGERGRQPEGCRAGDEGAAGEAAGGERLERVAEVGVGHREHLRKLHWMRAPGEARRPARVLMGWSSGPGTASPTTRAFRLRPASPPARAFRPEAPAASRCRARSAPAATAWRSNRTRTWCRTTPSLVAGVVVGRDVARPFAGDRHVDVGRELPLVVGAQIGDRDAADVDRDVRDRREAEALDRHVAPGVAARRIEEEGRRRDRGAAGEGDLLHRAVVFPEPRVGPDQIDVVVGGGDRKVVAEEAARRGSLSRRSRRSRSPGCPAGSGPVCLSVKPQVAPWSVDCE